MVAGAMAIGLVFARTWMVEIACGWVVAAIPAMGWARAESEWPLARVELTRAEEALSLHAARGFSGAVRVLRNGKTVFSGAAGLRDYHDPSKGTIEATDRFPIGSVTKQFTAAASLRLSEQGILSLDDPLGRFFTDIHWAEQVTLRQLLNHTAGVPNYTELYPILEMVARPWTPSELIGLFRDRSLEFAPGSAWSYSNSGYLLAGEVILKLTGKSWDEYLRDEFFLPLGMTDTGTTAEGGVPAGVMGFDQDERFEPAPTRTRHLSWADAAGALVSTTEDLARWNAALHGGMLLHPESYAAMIEPGLSDYGLGLIHSRVQVGEKQIEVIGHSGGLPGFFSKNYHYPEQAIDIIVLSNFTNNEDAVLAQTLAQLVLNGAAEVLKQPVFLENDPVLANEADGVYRFEELGLEARLRSDIVGELWIEIEGQGRMPLKLIGRDLFYLRFDDVVVELARVAAGGVVGFKLYQHGQVHRAVVIRSTP